MLSLDPLIGERSGERCLRPRRRAPGHNRGCAPTSLSRGNQSAGCPSGALKTELDGAVCFGMNSILITGDGQRVRVGQEIVVTLAF